MSESSKSSSIFVSLSVSVVTLIDKQRSLLEEDEQGMEERVSNS